MLIVVWKSPRMLRGLLRSRFGMREYRRTPAHTMKYDAEISGQDYGCRLRVYRSDLLGKDRSRGGQP